MRLGFFKRITVLIILLTLLTGVTITATSTYRIRREMYRLEHESAYMMYSATVNYFSAHFMRHGRYLPPNLDYVMAHQFMHLGPELDDEIRHRPVYVVIYDPLGRVRYEYRDDADLAKAEPISPDDLPRQVSLEHLHDHRLIRVSGPVDPQNSETGYTSVLIPTAVGQQVRTLLGQSIVLLLGVLSVTMLLSILFSRQVLAPIRALTRAARAVHRGTLKERVPVTTDDEIGELTGTFNNMLESLDRRMEFMHRMQEWTVRIGRQLDARRLFQTMGEMFEHMSMATSYRLYLQNQESGQLEVRLEYGPEGLPPPEKDTLSRMALLERWTLYLKPDGSADNEPGDAMELAIPLLSGKHPVGVIRIGRKSDQTLYDGDTLIILQTLAQHASVAIDNANLYERLAAQERMAQEMMLARQIQQSMLPRTAPVIEGYDIVGGSTPALEVGGDYFDYVAGKGYHYLLIGDVSGKGVPAALIMSIIRALVHTYLEFEISPARALCRVNRSISVDLDPEMFVTMSNLQLDPVHHQLRVARAGHEPVMIVHEDGKVDHLAPGGAALGMLPVPDFEAALEEARYRLRPDDTVIIYTDGITETQNTAHEEFGYDRLEQVAREKRHLPVHELYEEIIAELNQFRGGGPHLDDITLMIVRRTAQD